MANIFIDLKAKFLNGSLLLKLIYINAGVLIVVRLTEILMTLFNADPVPFLHCLQMPANLENLLIRPWTPVTYMFLQTGLLHLLFNMLWLYWFGKIFLLYFTEKQLGGLYLLGGLSGAFFYLVSYNVFPYFANVSEAAWMMGSSASVIAIVIATAFYLPDYKVNFMFIGPVALKYIALVTILLDMLSVTSGNAGGHIAHLGGAFMGFLFVVFWRKGKDLTKGINVFMDFVVNLFKPKPPRMKVSKPNRPETDQDYRDRKRKEMKEIDRILDKVKRTGYNQLTLEEKRKLFEAGDKKS